LGTDPLLASLAIFASLVVHPSCRPAGGGGSAPFLTVCLQGRLAVGTWKPRGGALVGEAKPRVRVVVPHRFAINHRSAAVVIDREGMNEQIKTDPVYPC